MTLGHNFGPGRPAATAPALDEPCRLTLGQVHQHLVALNRLADAIEDGDPELDTPANIAGGIRVLGEDLDRALDGAP